MVEVKPAGNDAWLTANSNQVTPYWSRHHLVLLTDYRDFLPIGEDADGNPAFWRVVDARALAVLPSTQTCNESLHSNLGAILFKYLDPWKQ